MPAYATGYDPAAALTGAELLQLVQSGGDVQATAKQVARLAWEELTQAQYDALGTPDPDTLYVITD